MWKKFVLPMEGALQSYRRDVVAGQLRLEEALDSVLDVEALSTLSWGPLNALALVQEAVTASVHSRMATALSKLDAVVAALRVHVSEARRSVVALQSAAADGERVRGALRTLERLEQDVLQRAAIVEQVATQRDRQALAALQDYWRAVDV